MRMFTITIPDDGATVEQGAVRGEQVPVEVNLGVCYIDFGATEGTTEFGFLPCDSSYEGDVVIVGGAIDDAATVTVPAQRGEQVAVVAQPTQMALPETGGEPFMLGIGTILLVVGLGLRKLALR